MIIGLFGLSGSGKTHLTNEFKILHQDYFCTSASDLLKASKRPVKSEALDTTNLNFNQYVLVEKLSEIYKIHKKIFIELHAIIEDKNGKYYKVDGHILNSLNLDLILFLDTPIEKILDQRNNDKKKTRPYTNLYQLKQLSFLQKKYLNEVFPNDKVKCIQKISDIEKLMPLS